MNYKLLQQLKDEIGKHDKESVRRQLKEAGFVEWEGFDLGMGEGTEVWSTMEEIGRYYHLIANKETIYGTQFAIVGCDEDFLNPIIVVISFRTSILPEGSQ